jgi:hypothetical protein
MAKAPVDPLAHIPATASGAAGGAVAGLGQFIGTTLPDTLSSLFAGELALSMIQFASFLIGTTMMAIAGAVVAFFLQSKTQSRWALFLAGAAATSIGTTALPGLAKLVKRVDLAPITVAHAEEQPTCDWQTKISLGRGLKEFFGLDFANYRVVVGSFKNHSDAVALAKKINDKDRSFGAFVDEKAPCNEFYPVIVGPRSTTLEDAKRIQEKAFGLDFIPGAFVSRRTF